MGTSFEWNSLNMIIDNVIYAFRIFTRLLNYFYELIRSIWWWSHDNEPHDWHRGDACEEGFYQRSQLSDRYHVWTLQHYFLNLMYLNNCKLN